MSTMLHKKGITLILAILILSAALGVALSIFNVIFVQLQINKGARESYKAFYSADAAKECVLYYVKKVNTQFGGGFWNPEEPCGSDSANGIPSNCHINCGGLTNIVVTQGSLQSGAACTALGVPSSVSLTGETLRSCRHYSFVLQNSPICTPAVGVDAVEYNDSSNLPSSVVTIITAEGNNSCTNASVTRTLQICDSPDPLSYCPQ